MVEMKIVHDYYYYGMYVCPLSNYEKIMKIWNVLPPLTVCELVYLGSVEVSGPGSESVVRETVEQLKTLGLSTMNIVTFKASMNGITLTDDING